jgi:hypothetical protein
VLDLALFGIVGAFLALLIAEFLSRRSPFVLLGKPSSSRGTEQAHGLVGREERGFGGGARAGGRLRKRVVTKSGK